MQWEFVIDPGQYEVQLYFSENNSQLQNIGSRVFDVLIEGNIVLNNYDIYSEAGAGFKGVSESFVITSDDTIDIDFARVTDNPTIFYKEDQIISGEDKNRYLELIQKVIRDEYLSILENEIAKQILSGEIKDGDTVKVEADKQLSFSASRKKRKETVKS